MKRKINRSNKKREYTIDKRAVGLYNYKKCKMCSSQVVKGSLFCSVDCKIYSQTLRLSKNSFRKSLYSLERAKIGQNKEFAKKRYKTIKLNLNKLKSAFRDFGKNQIKNHISSYGIQLQINK